MPSTPPASASGTVSTTTSASRSERNIAAISMNSTSSASRKFVAHGRRRSRRGDRRCRRAGCSHPAAAARAAPARCRSGSSRACLPATASAADRSSASRCGDDRCGGSAPAPASSRRFTSSPSETISPDGVISGACASSSGVSPRFARRMTGSRVWPSKYSPSHAPSPSARTTVPSEARSQPTSAMRRSFGLGAQLQRLHVRVRERLHVRAGEALLQQLAAFLGGGVERGRVGGLQMDRDRARRAADAAEQLAFVHEHARVGKPDDDFVAHDAFELADALRRRRRARRSCRRPATTGRSSSSGAAPSRPSCTAACVRAACRAISRLTASGLMPGGKLKYASMAARFTGGR